MDRTALISLVPMIALLGWAAWQDWRTRTIRNWLTFSLALGGLIHAAVNPAGITFAQSVTGLLTGFGIGLAMWLLGAFGGGDCKLLAGLGAWLGPWGVLLAFAAEAVLGMAIVIVQCARRGRLAALVRNSAVIGSSLALAAETGSMQAAQAASTVQSVDRPLPYAVPMLGGVLIALAVLVR